VSTHPLASVNGLAVVLAVIECGELQPRLRGIEKRYWITRRSMDNARWIWDVSGKAGA
jgi:hypothetical protein